MRIASARNGSRGGMDLSVYGKPPGPTTGDRNGSEVELDTLYTGRLPGDTHRAAARGTYRAPGGTQRRLPGGSRSLNIRASYAYRASHSGRRHRGVLRKALGLARAVRRR